MIEVTGLGVFRSEGGQVGLLCVGCWDRLQFDRDNCGHDTLSLLNDVAEW